MTSRELNKRSAAEAIRYAEHELGRTGCSVLGVKLGCGFNDALVLIQDEDETWTMLLIDLEVTEDSLEASDYHRN